MVYKFWFKTDFPKNENFLLCFKNTCLPTGDHFTTITIIPKHTQNANDVRGLTTTSGVFFHSSKSAEYINFQDKIIIT